MLEATITMERTTKEKKNLIRMEELNKNNQKRVEGE